MTLPGWAREPLVHFLLAGAVLFAAFGWVGEDVDPSSREIVVTREDRARLALQWEQSFARPPTDAELDALTEQFVREEVLYREALRLGLDRDDGVVRKRMANKMNYLAASAVDTAVPSDDTLRDWLDRHPARFAADSRFDFEHRYFAERDKAEAALARLATDPTVDLEGEAISLPAQLRAAPRTKVAAQFGEAYVRQLDTLEPTGEWQGPVASGFGWHLVRLTGKRTGSVPPLADIRQQVENDWRSETAQQRRAQAYAVLRDAYEVTVER